MPQAPASSASVTPRTIVIIGGVAGGASAAARARRCNEKARIILLEKDEHVSFANCGLPYYLGNEITDRNKLLVATPQKFREWFNIDVRTHSHVTAIDRSARTVTVLNRQTQQTDTVSYDRLILSPGASPIAPPLEGINASNVFTLRNLADTDRIKAFLDQMRVQGKTKAVVIGAGFIGLEMIEMLHKLTLQLALVELAPQVLPPLDPEMAHMIADELHQHGIALHLGNGLKSFITQNGIVTHVVLNDGTQLPTDMVMLAIGVRPNIELAKLAGLELGTTGGIKVNSFMQTSDPLIYAAGDSVEYHHQVMDMDMRIPLAGPANRAGRIAGEHAACDQATPMSPVLGTAIVRVFNKVAAVTGANLRSLGMMKSPYRSIYVPGNSHASYYPGAQEMVIKLLYHPDTHKVLGAQIVGGEGVDKRIDVLATAIRFGATIHDLTTLDLAYAPPFGSAKDPIHMAGFIAENDLASVAPIFPQQQLDAQGKPVAGSLQASKVQIVDVRTPAEWQAGHLEAAVHIPIHQLREQLSKLDPSKTTITVCRGGQRAYYASRILQQHGFSDVRTLTGGMMMRPHITPSSTPAATVQAACNLNPSGVRS